MAFLHNAKTCLKYKKICLKQHKISFIYKYPLCLINGSKGFTNDIIKKSGLNEYVHKVFYGGIIDFEDIFDVNNYLKKKHDIKQCLDFLNKDLIHS